MKRSIQIIVSLIFVGGTLSAVAGCPCARQKREMRAKKAQMQTAAPAAQAPLLRQGSEGQAAAMPAPTKEQPATTMAPMPAPTAAPAPMPMEKPVKRMKQEPAPMAQPAKMEGNKVVVNSEADFNAAIKNPKVFVLISTTWCGPCKAMKPAVEQLNNEMKDVTFVYVDGDNFPGLVQKHAPLGFPTVKFFKNGAEVGKAVGGQSKAELQSAINTYLK